MSNVDDFNKLFDEHDYLKKVNAELVEALEQRDAALKWFRENYKGTYQGPLVWVKNPLLKHGGGK